MRRRVLSLILALCMLLAGVPSLAIASGEGIQVERHAYAAGAHHFLTVKADNTLWAWGANDHGQIGDGTINHRPSPVKVMDDVAAAYAVGRTSFAITMDGKLYGWGSNKNGLLGTGNLDHSISPVLIESEVVSMLLTETGAFAVKDDGSLWNWGIDVGNKINGASSSMTPVKIMDEVVQAAIITDRAMILKTDGSLWGWGKDKGYGLVGDGGKTDRISPVKIADDVVKVAVAEYISILLLKDGTAWTWGLTSNSSASNPSYDSYPIRLTDKVKDIAGGADSVLLLREDGTLFSSGFDKVADSNGNPYLKRYHTLKIMEDCLKIFDGAGHFAAIAKDGSLWTWGENDVGQLGDGTTDNKSTPVRITDNVVEFLITETSTMALKADGGLWLWGMYGQNIDETGTGGNIAYPYKVTTNVMMPVEKEPDPEPDPDVDPRIDEASTWAKDNVLKAIEKKLVPASLIGGYKNNITRAEFCLQAVTFLEVKTGMKIEEFLATQDLIIGLSPFTDTYDRAVVAAYRLGIVNGRGEGLFDPDAAIARQEAAVMLTKTASVLGYATTAPSNSFSDKDTIDLWAITSVNFVADKKIMSGTLNGFEPKSKYTREQADTTFLLMFEALA